MKILTTQPHYCCRCGAEILSPIISEQELSYCCPNCGEVSLALSALTPADFVELNLRPEDSSACSPIVQEFLALKAN
jgi:predicted RNA-binding Zn-ribbon protein involved in translation (DUF1610 family)